MMIERLRLSREIISKDGGLLVSIDYNEDYYLRIILEELFGEEQYRNTIVPSRVKKSIKEREQVRALNWGHGYLIFFASSEKTKIMQPMRPFKRDRDDIWHAFDAPGVRSTMEYEIFGQKPPSSRHWMYSEEKARQMISEGTLRKTPKGKIEYKLPASEGIILDTNWTDIIESDSDWDFLTEKNVDFIKRAISMLIIKGDTVLDFFAGSGTTGHTIINLNREEARQCKFILVEMGNFFNNVLLRRIQKLLYTPEWKDGEPKRLPTKEEVDRTPRMVKVLRLESYEDALHNLVTDETLKKEEPRARAHREKLGEGNYRLNYLARLPLEASASMLNLAALEHPFQYNLEILTEDGPKIETVDLIETFNFLYGLHVERLETWINEKDKRNYRAVKGRNREGRRVLILWRDMERLDPVAERRFLEGKLKDEGSFEEILINGDSATPGVKSLDGFFKRLIEEGEQ